MLALMASRNAGTAVSVVQRGEVGNLVDSGVVVEAIAL